MIFLTVGTILPFDRLTKAVDEWAGLRSDIEVFGQIGDVSDENYLPQHFRWERRLNNADFKEKIHTSAAVIAHAGIGAIIEALQLGKQIVILPRERRFQEHVNDHQLQTIQRFAERPGIYGVTHESGLAKAMDAVLESMDAPPDVSEDAEEGLLCAVRQAIHGGAQN